MQGEKLLFPDLGMTAREAYELIITQALNPGNLPHPHPTSWLQLEEEESEVESSTLSWDLAYDPGVKGP